MTRQEDVPRYLGFGGRHGAVRHRSNKLFISQKTAVKKKWLVTARREADIKLNPRTGRIYVAARKRIPS